MQPTQCMQTTQAALSLMLLQFVQVIYMQIQEKQRVSFNKQDLSSCFSHFNAPLLPKTIFKAPLGWSLLWVIFLCSNLTP